MIFQNCLKFHEPLRITISKYHSWYLCQISLQTMLLPILIILVYDYRPNWTPLSPQYYHYKFHFAFTLNNGNRTSCRPIRSVIIRVINKIGRPSSGEFDLLIITITIFEKTNEFFYVKELSISIMQN